MTDKVWKACICGKVECGSTFSVDASSYGIIKLFLILRKASEVYAR